MGCIGKLLSDRLIAKQFCRRSWSPARRPSGPTPLRAPPRCPGPRRCTWWQAPAWRRVSLSSVIAVPASRAPDMPSGWPSAIAAAIRVDMFRIVGNAHLTQAGDGLGGEGFVEFDDVEIGRRHAEPFAKLVRGGCRADAHDPGRDPGAGAADHLGDRGSGRSVRRRQRRRPEAPPAPSLTPGRIARRNRSTLPERGRQFGGACPPSVPGRGCSSASTTIGSPLRCGMVTATISLASPPVFLRRAGAFLAARREGVLVVACHLKLLGHVLRRLRHGVDAVLRLHQGIDEPPAEWSCRRSRVEREKAVSALGMTKGARDMLSTPPTTTRSASSRLDRAGRAVEGLEARAAQPVDSRGGAHRSESPQAARPSEPRCGCSSPAWVGRSRKNHVIDVRPVHVLVALHERLQGDRGQIVRPHGGQAARGTVRSACARNHRYRRLSFRGFSFFSGTLCAASVRALRSRNASSSRAFRRGRFLDLGAVAHHPAGVLLDRLTGHARDGSRRP